MRLKKSANDRGFKRFKQLMDLLAYYNPIAYTSAFSVVIPLSIAAFRLKHRNSVNQILFVYLLLSLFAEVINFILLSKGMPNILSIELFKVAELFLITYIFTIVDAPDKIARVLIVFALSFALLLFFVDLNYHTTILFNGFSHCMIMVLCFMALYSMLDRERNISGYYFFWITAGILFYFSLSFFLFLLNDFTRSLSEALAKNLWLIALFANIFYYMFLSVGLWKIRSR